MSSYLTGSRQPDIAISTLVTFACLNALLIGAVYVSQLIFHEIAYSFAINILDSRFAFGLACLFYAISLFIYGPLSDRLPIKQLILWGCSATIVCLLVCSLARNYYLYLIFMVLMGCASAAVPTALFSYLAKNTPNDKLTLIMGLMVSSSIIGIIFSRSMVAILTDYWSWQSAFAVYALLIAAVGLLVLFVFTQAAPPVRYQPPVSIKASYVNLLKALDLTIITILVMGFCLFFVYLGVTSLLTYYLKSALFNLSSTQLGWINLSGLGAILGAIIADKLSKKISNTKTLLVLFSGIGMALLLIGYSENLVVIVGGMFIFFLFIFGIQPVIIAIFNQKFAIAIRGTASALYLLGCFLGGTIGISMLGAMWQYLSWQYLIDICLLLIAINMLLIVMCRKQLA